MGGKGSSMSSESFAGGGNRLAADGGGIAAARWGIASLPLFSRRQTAGDELAHLWDFGFGEQLDGGGFVGGDDGFGGVPVEVGEAWVGGVFGVG